MSPAMTSPGSRLREAREANGKSLSEMARITRIGIQQLEGLEADNYDRIPAPIYVRGFLKNYALALGLDPGPLLEACERIRGGGETSEGPAAPAGPGVPRPVGSAEKEAEAATEPPAAMGVRNRRAGPGNWISRWRRVWPSGPFPGLDRLHALRIPLDRRLAMVAGTVAGVLVVILGIRACSGPGGPKPDAAGAEAAAPADRFEIEALLIATPEPVTYELPRTTP